MAKVTLTNIKTKKQYQTTKERADKAVSMHPGVFHVTESKGMSKEAAKVKAEAVKPEKAKSEDNK